MSEISSVDLEGFVSQYKEETPDSINPYYNSSIISLHQNFENLPIIPLVVQNLGISQSQRLRFDPIEAASYPKDRSDADRVKDRDADTGKNQVLNHERYKTWERRAMIDIGSGGTKYTIADVETKTKEVQIALEGKIFVSYQKALEGSVDCTLSEEIQNEGIRSFEEIKEICSTYNVDRIHAVATEAFRKAGNTEAYVLRIKNETGIDVQVISQEIEGMIAYENAKISTPYTEKELVVWEVGTGSFQITSKKEDQYLFHMGGFGAVPFHEWVRNEVNENVLRMGQEGLKGADRLARSICWRAEKELKSKIRGDAGRTVVGIGNFFTRSLGGIDKKESATITRTDLRHFIAKTLEEGSEVENPFLKTDLTNAILALGFMKAFGIHEIKILDRSNTETMLTSELFWKN